MLTAYFDESGIHEGEHACVVAGFVGNSAQWESLIAQWIPAIHPRLNLHMKDLRWTQHPERIGPLLAKLGPIPHKYNLTPVFARLRWSDYNSIVKGKIDSQFTLTDPYAICAVLCISTVLTDVAGKDDVYFLFDRQEGLRRDSIEFLRDIVYDYFGFDSRVKGIDFIHRNSTVCLDPADYLAFTLWQRGIDPTSIKAKYGESILQKSGFGGSVAPDQLAWMLEGWKSDQNDKLENILARIMKTNPFFRGPR